MTAMSLFVLAAPARSCEMVRRASNLHPILRLEQGSLSLPLPPYFILLCAGRKLHPLAAHNTTAYLVVVRHLCSGFRTAACAGHFLGSTALLRSFPSTIKLLSRKGSFTMIAKVRCLLWRALPGHCRARRCLGTVARAHPSAHSIV